MITAEEDAVPVLENSGALFEETCICTDEVTKSVGTHEKCEVVLHKSLGG